MAILQTLNSIKNGMTLIYKDEPYLVLDARFVRMQKQKPVMQTKMRNIINGKTLEYSFKAGEKVEEADVERKKVSFLYSDSVGAHFMDNETYEQFSLNSDIMGENAKFLKDGTEVILMSFQNKPIGLQLPVKMEFKVTEAPPAVKGDTAQGKVTKPVTIETGHTVNTPIFIKEGDTIRINTDTGEYAERV